MYVCSCFGITEQQVKMHAEAGACTPRQIASASKAGTDCGGCVRTIQAMLGRGACPRRELLEQKQVPGTVDGLMPAGAPAGEPHLAPGADPALARPIALPDAA
ncbi:(2Fe-2S)-binding protein [Streptomyces sp. RKAG290]|uniref:(2Fe-2S)-binding protein n=1 Tax=Streptomyces sp. RKAG290 TaxID=2888348 RepID=UPI002034340B|nr:(2Fe-2S)-binding protein [Streptomyces sp. RKAG290]MCM2414609.1 (2Fe-2S)-binding protein [Streptomyces sp. RKAG290]